MVSEVEILLQNNSVSMKELIYIFERAKVGGYRKNETRVLIRDMIGNKYKIFFEKRFWEAIGEDCKWLIPQFHADQFFIQAYQDGIDRAVDFLYKQIKNSHETNEKADDSTIPSAEEKHISA